MNGFVADRIDLQVAGQHPMLFAADLNLEDAGEETGAAKLLFQFQGVDGNQHRVFLVAVNDAGYAAGAAGLPGGACSCSLALFGGECGHLGHILFSLGSERRLFQGAPPLDLFWGPC